MIFNRNFLTFDGSPVTGRVPPQLLVEGGVQLTREQEGAIAHAYKLFCDAQTTSVQGFLMQQRTLPDGTQLRMEHHGNAGDRVFVKPPPTGAPLRYELLPAFLQNAPDVADPFPDPVNSATWKTMPYNSDGLPKLHEDFRRTHPGCMTWYDARETSRNRGLVLSWWAIARNRYDPGFSRDSSYEASEVASAERKKLYCNGVVIGEFSDPIMGACITTVDGVEKICVVTAAATKSTGSGTYRRFWGTARGVFTSSVAMTLNYAKLPALFRAFQFRKLDFPDTTACTIAQHQPIDVDGNDYWFHQLFSVGIDLAQGIKFNSSGTQGIINAPNCYVVPTGRTVSTGGADEYFVYPLYIDPRDGTLAALSADSWSPVIYPVMFDYAEDTIVFAGVKSGPQDLYSSQDGTLLTEGPYTADVILCGDLRARCVTLALLSSDGMGGQQVRTRRYIEDVEVDDTTITGLGTGTAENLFYGFEGADSSFDRRLIVDRTPAGVKLYADKVDVTDDQDPGLNLQDAAFPVLCGPITRITGKPQPQDRYVKGDPP